MTRIPKPTHIAEPWLTVYPKITPRELEYEFIPLDEMVARNAQKIPNQNALAFEGWHITHAALNQLINQFATALCKLGISHNDVVLLDVPNSPQFVIAFFAILRIGAIANPIIPLNRFAEIVHQSNDSKGKALIILDSLYEEHLHGKDLTKMTTLKMIILTAVKEYLPKIKGILGPLLGKVPYMKIWPTSLPSIEVYKFQDLLCMGLPVSLPKVQIDVERDPAVLIYTGGTTGDPKGVIMTHANLMANCQQALKWVIQIEDIMELTAKGGMVVILPLAHSFGLSVGMNMGFYIGFQLVLIPSPPKPISKLLKTMKDEFAVFCPGVPTLWNRINQDPKSEKFRGKLAYFRGGLSGAAALPLEVKQKFETLTGCLLIEGYGMSETAPILTANPFHRSVPNSVGVPFPDTYIKIVDPDEGVIQYPPCPYKGTECTEKCGPETQKYIGEICGCGPQVMQGYFGKLEESQHVLRKDAQGFTWYYTSDIGCLDAEGYLHIKDRKRDMFKRRGHAVFPREIEDLMYMYEPILEVGVYGVKSPDIEIGEEIKAAVSIKPEYRGKITVEDINAWVQKNISPIKYPREIKIMDDLPKSPVGKILRRVLRDMDSQPTPPKP